jgi:endo-1,4-beta-xylanase
VFRHERRKLSGVTFWGMADDDTWLDGFPVARTDYPLPFNMGLQAKPAYWGIVDPTQLPGFGLKFEISSKTGDRDARVWTITAKNGDVGPAYATQITGFTLLQDSGRRCNPVVTAPSSFPVLLGDIATSGSASAAFTIDFASCDHFAHFILSMPWSSATYDTGTFVSGFDFRRGRDWER